MSAARRAIPPCPRFAPLQSCSCSVAPSGIGRGDVWPGLHVRIKYTLTVIAADVRYEREIRHGGRQRLQLSQCFSRQESANLLNMSRSIKQSGGSVDVNEAGACFALIAGNGVTNGCIPAIREAIVVPGTGVQRQRSGHTSVATAYPGVDRSAITSG